MKNQEKEISKIPKLNIRNRSLKKQISLTISEDHDLAICRFAIEKEILNQFGQPNRSGAVERLIELFATSGLQHDTTESTA